MQALYCAHPWMHPRLQSSPFGLSLCSQSHSSPHICLLKPEFGTQPLQHTGKEHLRLGSTERGTALFVVVSIFFLLKAGFCTLLWASEAPYLFKQISQLVNGVPKVGDLSSVTTPTQVHKSSPDSFIFFHPTQFMVIFLPCFVVWDLPAFSLHSVRTVPQVYELLRYLGEEVSSMSFFLSPSSHL